jgi:hypothetical protein
MVRFATLIQEPYKDSLKHVINLTGISFSVRPHRRTMKIGALDLTILLQIAFH